jgi:hypothetical protein
MSEPQPRPVKGVKRFDASGKSLIAAFPRDWLALLGIEVPASVPVEAVDADLSTVTASADKVVRVGGPEPWIFHGELQAGRDASLPGRARLYNAAAAHRHGVPVRTVLFLLRPEADSPALTGEWVRRPPGGPESVFRYEAVRLWRWPVESVLSAGIGTLPLATLCDRGGVSPDEVFRRLDGRLSAEAPPGVAEELLTAAAILSGLLKANPFGEMLRKAVTKMRESTVYQEILAEGEARGEARGKAREARRMLLLAGETHLGPADGSVVSRLDAIADVDRLERMCRRLVKSGSWDDLLSTP